MEAPTAKNFKKIDFNYEDQKISITLSYLSKIKISLNCLNKRQIFENEFSYDEITKINRFFLMCETLKDIFDELSNLMNDNMKINFTKNALTLTILIPSQKNKEADFNLKLKAKTLEEEINYLNERIDDLEKIVKEQNIKISNQEIDIKMLKESKLNLEIKISEFESRIIKIENKKKILEDEKIDKLKKIIGKNCNLKLLYQMKTDGNLCETFHKKVDNQGPTITLFETECGYKFGGYTSKSFNNNGGWIKDSDSFLFNFLNNKIFPIKNPDYDAIFLGKKYGPEFYDILNNKNDVRIGEIRVSYFINKIDDLKGEGSKFISKNVSVYKVEFI